MSKKKSRATKTVLASLLATSAIVPAMAVSAADVTGTDATTSTATKTIDFKVEEASGMLARFVKGPGELTERDGQKYIKLNLTDAVLAMVTEVTVAGKTAIYEYGGTKTVLIPVSADYAPVVVDFKITSPAGAGEYKATLTPDASSIKDAAATTDKEEKPAETGKPFAPGKKFDKVADGTYDVTFDAYDPKTNVGNYTAITNHFNKNAKLIVKDNKYTVEVTLAEKSNSMIAGLKVAGKEATVVSGTATEGTRVMSFAIDSISDLHEASVHVVVPEAKMDKEYPFGFAIDTAKLDLPAAGVTEPAKPAPTVETIPVSVFKDGEKELSIMHGKYLADKVQVTATEGGYNVDITFPEGQHLKGFDVKGATVALKSEETVGTNTVKIYTVAVKDLAKVYDATVDLSVRQGPVSYDEVYTVQLQFGDKKSSAVPFTDIKGLANYDAIASLYAKGIFKDAEKFNPQNNVKRSQFALMLNRALSLEVPASTKFADIASYDAETQNAIKALNNYGVINGKTATTFAPNQEITRKQAALMIYRLLEKEGYKATGATANFKDVSSKDAEAAKAIAELNKLGIMTGFEGKFNPENKLTRNQMAKVLNNALQAITASK